MRGVIEVILGIIVGSGVGDNRGLLQAYYKQALVEICITERGD